MKAVRLWSNLDAGWLKKRCSTLDGTLALFKSLLKAIGYERLDKPLAAMEGGGYIDLIEQVREIEAMSSVHIVACRLEDRIGEIVSCSNALGGREPWRPAVSSTTLEPYYDFFFISDKIRQHS